MKTTEATRLYNEAEAIVNKRDDIVLYSCAATIKRAIEIENLLIELHGEDTADEILELVFQNEIM